ARAPVQLPNPTQAPHPGRRGGARMCLPGKRGKLGHHRRGHERLRRAGHVLRPAVPTQKRVPAGIERRMPILSDVAEEASVSLTTASRALDPDNDHPVSDRTRARVLAAATRLDYRPNPMARALPTPGV